MMKDVASLQKEKRKDLTRRDINMIEFSSIVELSGNAQWEAVDDEAVVLNMKNSHYYSLNEVGKFIWEKIDGNATLSDILDQIMETYEVDTESARQDLSDIIDELLKEGLLSIKEG